MQRLSNKPQSDLFFANGSAGLGINSLSDVTWDPSALGATLNGWWDAADDSTITIATGVSQWNDKSGNGYNAVQATTGVQPAYTTAGLNGKNVLTFTDDELNATGVVLTGTGWDFYVVASYASTTDSFGRLLSLSSGSVDHNNATSWIPIYAPSANAATAFQNGSGASPNVSLTADEATIMQSSILASSLTTWKNGTQIGTKGSASSLNTTSGLRIGQSINSIDENWDGIVAEIVLTTTLSTTNRQKMEGYLAHKWGLTAGLPNDHPYKSAAPTL
jgi:hypothetical protein